VHVGVGAQDVGQGHRVDVVGLAAADRVPFPVSGDGHRVDGIDRASGRSQGCNQQSTGRLDRHRDRSVRAVAGIGQQCQQLGESFG
jgi:hypothetical protein